MGKVLFFVVLAIGLSSCAIAWLAGAISGLQAARLRRPQVGWWTAYSSVFPSLFTLGVDPATIYTQEGLAARTRARRCALLMLVLIVVVFAVCVPLSKFVYPE